MNRIPRQMTNEESKLYAAIVCEERAIAISQGKINNALLQLQALQEGKA